MKVAILCDSPDEQWPSMDLVGAMLADQLGALGIAHQVFAPPIPRRTGRSPVDRLLFRFGTYPRLVRSLAGQFDIFHIVDHSYSQLIHHLPPQRVVVTCHDLDTFRSVLEPKRVVRGPAFRWMTQRILSGFQKAAFVTCDSETTMQEVRKFDLLPASRMSVVRLGVHPSCSARPDESADSEAARMLNGFGGPLLLHVGSTQARKRIDVLLRVLQAVRKRDNDARLIRVGGPLTPEYRALAIELGVLDHVMELPFLSREVLAAVYRRATLVLQPSEAEGFGLPIVEAMACGSRVIASDLPVLREAGGSAVYYCPVGDVDLWTSAVLDKLSPATDQERKATSKQASQFSWIKFAETVLEVYNKVLNA
jgi:glycosyltransferase involved in cell wall biosynthesis